MEHNHQDLTSHRNKVTITTFSYSLQHIILSRVVFTTGFHLYKTLEFAVTQHDVGNNLPIEASGVSATSIDLVCGDLL